MEPRGSDVNTPPLRLQRPTRNWCLYFETSIITLYLSVLYLTGGAWSDRTAWTQGTDPAQMSKYALYQPTLTLSYLISYREIKVFQGFQVNRVLKANLVQEALLALPALLGPQFPLEGPLRWTWRYRNTALVNSELSGSLVLVMRLDV